MAGGDAMSARSFGDIKAEFVNGEWEFCYYGNAYFSERTMEQFENDIRSARLWVRDQKQRQKAEKDTPELPL
jgi:uncharacterized protein YutD